MMHLLPQLPCKNRYTEDWIGMWKRELTNLGIKFTVLGDNTPVPVTKYFTDPDRALRYECDQIRRLSWCSPEKIFCLDVDFPGLLSSAIPVLKLMNPKLKCYGYLHAGSWCNGDIFSSFLGKCWMDDEGTFRRTPVKKGLERVMFDIYDEIFVATNYHKNKIENYFEQPFRNIRVVGFPFYGKDVWRYGEPLPFGEKDLILISGRMEQSNQDLVVRIKENFKDEKIVVVNANSRKEYYELLNRGRVVISLKTEETFGIGQLETYVLGGIPLSPNNFAYPEVIGNECLLYRNEKDLIDKLACLLELKENPFQIDVEKYEHVISTCIHSL